MTRARALGVGRVHRGHVLRGRPQAGHLDGRVAGPAAVDRLRGRAAGSLRRRRDLHRAGKVLRQPAAVSGLALDREPGAGHVHRQTVPGRIRSSCERRTITV